MLRSFFSISTAIALAVGLAGCGNPQQSAATNMAVVDVGLCALAIVPVVAPLANGGGSNFAKGMQSAQVAATTASTNPNCPKIAADVQAAIAAGQVTAPAAAVPAAQ